MMVDTTLYTVSAIISEESLETEKELQMNLLIADDEPLTREMLKNCIDWKRIGISTLYFASDGIEALDIIQERAPEILLLDIVMPNLTGMEVVRKLTKLGSNAQVVFLTGFCDKKYLKEAIKLGVVDFLEKPIDMLEVEKSIKIIVDKVRENNILVYSVFNNQDRQHMALLYKESLENKDKGLFDEVVMQHDGVGSFDHICAAVIENDIKKGLPISSLISLVESIYSHKDSHAVFFIVGHTLIHIYLYSDSEHQLLQHIDKLKSFVVTHNQSCGYATARISKTSPYELLQRSLQAKELNFYTSSADSNFTIYRNHQLSPDDVPFLEFKDSLISLNFELGVTIVNVFIHRLLMHRYTNVQFVTSQLDLFVNALKEMMYDNYLLFSQESEIKQKIQMFDGFSLEDYRNLLTYILKRFKEVYYNERLSVPVTLAIQYIAENYKNPHVQIADIAAFSHISITYLCKVFKKEYGLTMNKYLQNYRLQRAKEMLSDYSKTIADIAYSVGFNDTRYFSKVFKTNEKMTPSDFREQNYGHLL